MAQTQKFSGSEKSDEIVDLHKDIENLKAAFAQTAEDLKAKFKEKSDDLEENMFGFVKKHPAKTIAISVVAGMLLAKILQK